MRRGITAIRGVGLVVWRVALGVLGENVAAPTLIPSQAESGSDTLYVPSGQVIGGPECEVVLEIDLMPFRSLLASVPGP
jgi:hypothetical protein